MTWLRIDDRFPRHRKVAPLSDRAFRLHVTAMAECCESGTDGHVGSTVPATLTCAPHGKALRVVIDELEAAGLWEVVDGGGWQIHDFLDWNLSAADARVLREARASAGRRGGQAKRQAASKQVLQQKPSNGQAKRNPEPDPVSETAEDSAEADASAPFLVPIDDLFLSDAAERTTAPARKEQRAYRLPKVFPLTAELRTIAVNHGCRDPERMHAAFCDCFHASGRTKLDWIATYRTWARDGHSANIVKACGCHKGRAAPVHGSLTSANIVREKYRATGEIP